MERLRFSIPGGLLGILVVAGWLWGWQQVGASADRFAPVAAIIAALSLSLALFSRHQFLRTALRTIGGVSGLLAIAAALSLGVFIPPAIADWVSPVLGRFGGAVALSILAFAALTAALFGWAGRCRGTALDATALLAVGAIWIASQTARQATFPLSLITGPVLASRAGICFVIAAALAAGSCGWWLLDRLFAGRRARADSALLPALCRWCWRWSLVASLLGAALSVRAAPDLSLRCGILGGAIFVGGLVPGWRPAGASNLVATLGRTVGWLVLVALALALVYGAVSEDIEMALLRNTASYRALSFWRNVTGARGEQPGATGGISGTVRDTAGRPIGGASVVVTTLTGRVYAALSGPDGAYQIVGVPPGSYLPLAVAPETIQERRAGHTGALAAVRGTTITGGVDFQLRPQPAFSTATNDSLRLGKQTDLPFTGLISGTVLRRQFEFSNRGMTLPGGLVHEPPANAGSGPFPLLLIIYPGEAAAWESVSAPLATSGYIVVSYFPRRLLDLEGDLDDLRLLFNLVATGQFSARGDSNQIVLVGGSVSTVYTYLLAHAIAGNPAATRLKALIQYGGLFDLYAFHHDWQAGHVTIDPGISELEYLLTAFGRPDNWPELYLYFSPRYGLGPHTLPPTLLVHAERDIIVPPNQSEYAAESLRYVKIPHTFLRYPDLEHYLDVSRQDPEQLDMLYQTLAFLEDWTGK